MREGPLLFDDRFVSPRRRFLTAFPPAWNTSRRRKQKCHVHNCGEHWYISVWGPFYRRRRSLYCTNSAEDLKLHWSADAVRRTKAESATIIDQKVSERFEPGPSQVTISNMGSSQDFVSGVGQCQETANGGLDGLPTTESFSVSDIFLKF